MVVSDGWLWLMYWYVHIYTHTFTHMYIDMYIYIYAMVGYASWWLTNGQSWLMTINDVGVHWYGSSEHLRSSVVASLIQLLCCKGGWLSEWSKPRLRPWLRWFMLPGHWRLSERSILRSDRVPTDYEGHPNQDCAKYHHSCMVSGNLYCGHLPCVSDHDPLAGYALRPF